MEKLYTEPTEEAIKRLKINLSHLTLSIIIWKKDY